MPATALLVLLAVLPMMIVLGGGSAQATSCVGWPDDVSDQIVHGRLPDLTGAGGTEAFTARYDYAVIGTVTAVRGNGQDGQPVQVLVDVRAALFQPAGRALTLQMADAGAMLGFPFETGHTYLIPVKSRGPDGLRNYVMLCDPVRDVAGSEVAGLLASARSAGVPVTEPAEPAARGTAQTGATPAVATQDLATPAQAPASDWARWLGLAAIVLLGVMAAAVVLRRRNRRITAARTR